MASVQIKLSAGMHSKQTAAYLHVIRHGGARKAGTDGHTIRECCSFDIAQLLHYCGDAGSCDVADYCTVNMHRQVLWQPRGH